MVGPGRGRCWPTARSSRSGPAPPPSCARSATSPPTPRTSWPTRSPRRPWPGRSACPPAAVRDGLRAFTPDGHRIAEVAEVDGVRYVDDSKATNPHAAKSSLQAYDPVVWVAGGLAKGASFDDLVAGVRDRLRGVVLLGRDRAVIAEALARHAPDVRVIEVEGGDTSVMDRVVGAAADLAQPGDTVLLAPGCASMDMFANYGARGDAFAESVRRLRER